ncbi:MAG: hypothetical protein OXC38_00010 [Gammaproteobacteria bacterium]|nr:hypothetical protein [Gammaproteobacteria bacterium]
MSVRGKLYQGGTTLAREAALTRAESGEFTAVVASEGKTVSLGHMRGVTARVSGSDRLVYFSNDFAFSTDDHEGLDALLPEGQARRNRFLAFFEQTRIGYALALLILLLGLVVAYQVFPGWFSEMLEGLIHFEFIPFEFDRDEGAWAVLCDAYSGMICFQTEG